MQACELVAPLLLAGKDLLTASCLTLQTAKRLLASRADAAEWQLWGTYAKDLSRALLDILGATRDQVGSGKKKGT